MVKMYVISGHNAGKIALNDSTFQSVIFMYIMNTQDNNENSFCTQRKKCET